VQTFESFTSASLPTFGVEALCFGALCVAQADGPLDRFLRTLRTIDTPSQMCCRLGAWCSSNPAHLDILWQARIAASATGSSAYNASYATIQPCIVTLLNYVSHLYK
jgi:hypothetical protein